VRNGGESPIATAFVIEMGESQGRFQRLDALGAHATGAIVLSAAPSRPKAETVAALEDAVCSALVAEGLYQDEARAMVRTWSTTSLGAEGTRVVYLVPRAAVDAALPLSIEPAPDQLTRVLVGRHEYLTPEAEDAVSAAVRDATSPTKRDDALRRLARFGR